MMGWRRAIRRLPLAGAAVAGAAVGHSIAYLIVAPQGPARDEPWAWLAGRLSLLQVTIFLVQEVVERAASGHAIDDLLSDRLLSIGVLVQILVAVGVATLLVWLGRAAEALGRALGRERPLRPVRVAIAWPSVVVRPTSLARRADGIRAPPRLRTA